MLRTPEDSEASNEEMRATIFWDYWISEIGYWGFFHFYFIGFLFDFLALLHFIHYYYANSFCCSSKDVSVSRSCPVGCLFVSVRGSLMGLFGAVCLVWISSPFFICLGQVAVAWHGSYSLPTKMKPSFSEMSGHRTVVP